MGWPNTSELPASEGNTHVEVGVPSAAGDPASAALAGNSATKAFSALVNPDMPVTIGIDWDAAWDGGDVNIAGTNQFDEPVSETLVADPGNLTQTLNAYKTITSAAKTAVGANAATATLAFGNRIGVKARIADPNSAVTMHCANGTTDPWVLDTHRPDCDATYSTIAATGAVN